MADGGEGSQELTVESKVESLSVRQLPGEEGEWGPRLLHMLLEYPTHMCI